MAMEITFLGTGPTGGIRAKGKTGRLESSVLIKIQNKNILIDVTRDFSKQAKLITDIDAVLLTHAHIDAIGGIKKFDNWLKKRVPVYSLPATLKRVKKVKNLDLVPIKLWQTFSPDQTLGLAMTILPIPVRHSIQKGFPTLGFIFNSQLAYASDTSGWSKRVESILKKVDVLILDGAMWGKKLISHLDIKQILPEICHWSNRKIIFTQIGHTAPRHKILKKEIKKICAKALPAYDSMRLRI